MQANVIETVLALISEQPSWLVVGIAIMLLYLTFMHPIRVMQFHALFAGFIEKLSSRAARHNVAVDIQSKVTGYIKSYHAESILPYKLKFKWMQVNNVESYTEKGDVIVVMDYKKNNDRNFINAIRGYTSQAFLPDIRHDLPPKFLTAAELVIQENIIRSQRRSALSIFHSEVVPSQIVRDKEINAYYNTLTNIGMLGFFDNILLNEVVQSKEILRSMAPDERDVEIHNFVTFLETFWERKSGEDVPLTHTGHIFKVTIILVARSDKIYSSVGAYVRRAEKALASGFKSVYVTGVKYDYDFTGKVIKELEQKIPEKLVWVRIYKSHRKMKNLQDARIAFLRY